VSLSALLFDLDDTLVTEWEGVDAAYQSVVCQVWGEASEARMLELSASAQAIWDAEAPADYCRRVHLDVEEGLYGDLLGGGDAPFGADDDAEVARAASELLQRRAFDDALPPPWRLRSPELLATWRRARIEAVTLFEETLAVLERWSARVPLGLVTNGASVQQRNKLDATGLGRWFSAIAISEEVGVGKPDPAPFAAVLGELGIEPGAAAMVGNAPDRDIAGAIAAGVRPVWIRRPDNRDEDLSVPDGVDVIADLRELEPLLS
jgi:putative hydrolase of the HAD superfamily